MMKTSLKHYLCGFNGFRQIDLLAMDKTVQEHSEGASHQLKEIAANSTDTDMTNGKIKQFYFDPQEVDTQIKLCTWSNIWSISDTGKIGCYGNSSSPQMTELQGEKKGVAVTLVQSGENVLLQEAGDSTVLIHDTGKVSKIVADTDHVSLVDSTRECVWGIKADGQCFEGQIRETREESEVWMLCLHSVMEKIDVQTVSCGFEHTLILTKHGSVYTNGNGSRGQLGHGEVTVDLLKVPKFVETLNGIKVVAIAAGGWHSTAVTDTGDIYVWGWNESGQLGLPNGAVSTHENQKTNSSYTDVDTSGSFAADSELDIKESKYGDRATNNPCIINEAKIIKQEGCKRKFAEENTCTENTGDPCDPKESFDQDSTRKIVEVTEVNTDNKNDQSSLTENVSRIQFVPGSACEDCVQLKFYQDLDSVQVQAVPYGLDIPDEMNVKTVSCGSRHTCLLTDSGVLLTSGWNNYGQLCHRDTRGRDYFEIVTCFESEKVISVTAQCWNTYIVTEKMTRVK